MRGEGDDTENMKTGHRRCRRWGIQRSILQEAEQQGKQQGSETTYSPVGCSYLPVAGVSKCAERDMVGM